MTIQEIEAKQVQLELELATALEAAKVLTPATAEFDEAYGRYLNAKVAIAKIPDEIARQKLTENAADIKAAGDTVAEALAQLVDGLKVADLLGTPVIALRYYRTASKDEAGNETIATGCVFNPIIKVSSGKAGGGSKVAGHTMIVDAQGNKFSCTKFVQAHATEAELASQDYKYPHTRVDSRPKFDEFCTAHNLTGFTYELPTTTAS